MPYGDTSKQRRPLQLFNGAPPGCSQEEDCIITHHCSLRRKSDHSKLICPRGKGEGSNFTRKIITGLVDNEAFS